MAKPVILTCALTPERESELRALCAPVRVRPLAAEELGRTVGDLAGVSPKGVPASAEPIPEELLIVCVPNGKWDAILESITPFKALKAVMTDTNRHWSVSALYRELCAERESLNP